MSCSGRTRIDMGGTLTGAPSIHYLGWVLAAACRLQPSVAGARCGVAASVCHVRHDRRSRSAGLDHGYQRARRRARVEVLAHTFEDRFREPLLMLRVDEPSFLGRVRYESSLD